MKTLSPRTTKNSQCRQGVAGRIWVRGAITAAVVAFGFLILTGCALADALQHYQNPAEPLHEYALTVTSQGTPINVIKMTPQPATPTPASCQETQGAVNRVTFPSAELEDDFTFSIYTPPCYDSARPDAYPVVYLLHGQLQDDRIWFDELGAAQIADAAILAGRKPFVIVAPYEEDNFAPVVDSMFGAAVVKDLIPYVEANYRVCTTRECRAIGGISHGAGWAVHIAIMNIDLFGSVGAHSVGYFIGDSTRIDRLLKTMTAQDFPRFYVDRGDRDYLADEIDALHRTLARNGIDHTYIVQAGSHSVSYWSAHIAEYLQWYMDGWDPPA